MAKKEKRPITYKEAHNRAVRMFQRCSIFLLWAGVVNVFAALIGVIQIAAKTTFAVEYVWPNSGFALTLTSQMVINNLLLKSMGSTGACLLIMLISIILGGLFALGGYMAARGRIALLFVGIGVYALDFAGMFFAYKYLLPFAWTNYAFTLVIHVVVLLALALAVVEFYNVLHIEKVFHGEASSKMEEEVESEVIASGKE